MKAIKKHRKIFHFLAIILAVIIIAAMFLSNKTQSNETKTPSMPRIDITPIPELRSQSRPQIFVTHTIINPGQIPLRATILAREASGFDEIEIFVDAGNGYEKIVCASLPCEAARNYTKPGIVKYYAVAKSAQGSAVDPGGAPQAYKSFSVG